MPLTSYNPATGEAIGEIPITSVKEINQQVQTAKDSLAKWREYSLSQRAECLKKAGQALVDGAEFFGDILSQEVGKPLKSGIGEVNSCGQNMANKVDTLLAALQPVVHRAEHVETTVTYEPAGVVAVISPWNFPMSMPQWMVIPALMAGNCVILKPSEETPLTAQHYVDTLNRFLPDGVLQIAQGGDEQGKALVSEDINLLVFTGSRAVGVDIMQANAYRLLPMILELGGKDPLIVMADADIEQAAQFAVNNSVENAGQMCIATERVFIHEDIADTFEQRVTEIAAEIKVGPWNEKDVQMGPMINVNQKKRVVQQINDALKQGATMLSGEAELPGAYLAPTVLTGVAHDMAIASEETFGPVVSITRYRDIRDAVRQANDTPYGLGAVVFGGDKETTEAVASQLDAGMIGINKSIFGVGDTPWVGAKQSGYGYHGSPDGARQFAQARVTSRVLR